MTHILFNMYSNEQEIHTASDSFRIAHAVDHFILIGVGKERRTLV